MNPSVCQNLQQLEKMLDSYKRLMFKLKDPDIIYHQRQILRASLDMLKEMMSDKTRDINQQLHNEMSRENR